MRAAELRIGNFVSRHRGGFPVVEIAEASPGLIAFVSSCEMADQPHYLDGIFITEEWLHKFGIIDGDKFPANEYFQIHHSQAGFKEYGLYFEDEFTGRYIKYVHELQNLYFAITGEELKQKQIN